jgi:hypothetical protein
MKYGRKPVRYVRGSLIRTHIIARYLSALGPPPGASPDWVSAVMQQSPHGWGVDGNDLYGDCVFADCAHQEMLRTANVGTIVIPTTQQVLALYSAVTGFDPNNPYSDQGADEQTVVLYLTATGWLGRKLYAHASLDPTQFDQIKWVVCLFGASRLGINLPASAINQFNAGQPWDYVAGSPLDGGHDVPVVRYDADGTIWVVTWGKLQPVTPAFMAAHYDDGMPYVEEAHAELAFDWVNAAGASPSSLNLAQLLQDLTAVVDPAPPTPPPLGPPTPPPAPPPGPPSPPPRPATSKGQLAYLLKMAIRADLANRHMTEAEMKADLQSILDAN